MEGESHPQRGELEQVHSLGQPDRHPLRVSAGPLPGRQHLPRVQGGHAGRRDGDLQWDLRHSLLAGIRPHSVTEIHFKTLSYLLYLESSAVY